MSEFGETIDKVWYEDLGFCGCYDPEEVLERIADVLEAIDSYKNLVENVKHDEIYPLWKPLMRGENLILGYIIDKCGLTDHGSSINACWVTEKGAEFLKEWKEFKKQS